MKFFIILFFMIVSLVALYLSAGALGRRANFAGSTALSASIGALLWLHQPSYLVILATALMVLMDLVAYFFGRSIAILAEKEAKPNTQSRLYRSSVIFASITIVSTVSWMVWNFNFLVSSAEKNADASLTGFHQFLWGDGFLFTILILLLVLLAGLGTFFMAQKET